MSFAFGGSTFFMLEATLGKSLSGETYPMTSAGPPATSKSGVRVEVLSSEAERYATFVSG
jgi:hypothetical protein